MNDKFLEEASRPPLINLKASKPFSSGVKARFTAMTWEIDNKNGKILWMEGKTMGISKEKGYTETYNRIEPKTFKDIADFILEGGVCYVPCRKGFIEAIDNYLTELEAVTLARTQEARHSTSGLQDYLVYSHGGCRRIRKGNTHGIIFSFWEAFSQSIADRLQDSVSNPIPLEEFFPIFKAQFGLFELEGMSLRSMYSPGSVVSNLVSSTFARNMFTKIEDIPIKVLEDAHLAYSGGVFISSRNTRQEADSYDIVGAYPSEMSQLVSTSPEGMDWHDVKDVPKGKIKNMLLEEAFYAFLYCEIVPTHDQEIGPTSFRYKTSLGKSRLTDYVGPQRKWITIREYEFLVTYERASVDVLSGSIGVPTEVLKRGLAGTVAKLQRLKKNPEMGRLAKLSSQALSGKMGSSYPTRKLLGSLGDEDNPFLHFWKEIETQTSPIYNPIYASHVNGAIRAKVAFMSWKYSAYAIRSDQILVPKGTVIKEQGTNLGDWKFKGSGLFLNPDDILLDTPGTTFYLEKIQTSPYEESYRLPVTYITSVAGELGHTHYSRRPIAGIVKVNNSLRRMGSSARFPLSRKSRGALLDEGIKHRSPKDELDLQLISESGEDNAQL